MATLADWKGRLRRPLQLELRSGCHDTVIVGGVEALVRGLPASLRPLASTLDGYANMTTDERRDRLEAVLTELAAQDQAAPAAASASPEAREARLRPDGLDAPLTERLVDVGHQAPKKLGEVGVGTYRDLLYHLPRRYEDRRALPAFASLRDGEVATVRGEVVSRAGMKSRRGMHVFRAGLMDAGGARVTAVWFNQPWLEKQVFPGARLVLSGKVKRVGRQAEILVQGFEVDDDSESLSFDRIVGIYPSTQGLSQAYVRRAARRLLDALGQVPDHLPRSLLGRHDLIPLDQALRAVHFPASEEELGRAMRRLKFDDFLFFELAVLRSRDPNRAGRSFRVDSDDLAAFEDVLPFDFTQAQERALDEILADMQAPRQMARLLQGDVGSGKTAVAAAAIYVAVRNGAQAALMAPTEILARQHFLNLQQYLYPLGVRSELLVGAMTATERRAARARLNDGEADLAVGTHALIQEGVVFRDLGLAVIDEEHRFGVTQRRSLVRGMPDVLVMSATPIPRSLALTTYGDLELTVIDGMPPGRKPIATRLVNAARRREIYRFAWEQVRAGRQVYVVTPLIEESEALDEVVATTQLAEDLRSILPTEARIGVLHGRMPAAEKDDVMAAFRRHDVDLLVSTTVIEVGVDVPNATVMIIENAERFGLSQLHQLRGRVGRGAHESHCVLVAGDRSRKTQKRLEIVAKHGDGFAIAEMDLQLRGPGDVRGTRQSGLPELSIGDLVTDGAIIEEARDLAKRMLEADPDLRAPWASRLRVELRRRSEAVMVREVI
ncbi:MAG: ATP-dependent DNA helicase RecG [Trueperaceae bacterium]